MSAAIYLAFVAGIVLLALLGAILNEFVAPILVLAGDHATSPESEMGLEWATSIWEFFPLLVLGLLVFGLIVSIVNRRQQVGGVR